MEPIRLGLFLFGWLLILTSLYYFSVELTYSVAALNALYTGVLWFLYLLAFIFAIGFIAMVLSKVLQNRQG